MKEQQKPQGPSHKQPNAPAAPANPSKAPNKEHDKKWRQGGC